MLYGLLLAFFLFVSFLLVLIVLAQQGKGSMGLGNIGGATQMIFGGSGGQDLFQKTTWVLGAIFMACSLLLALMKTSAYSGTAMLRRIKTEQRAPQNIPDFID